MAVKIRLKRMGSKKRPFYRIVAADSRSPRDGRFIETLGTYNPMTKDAELTVKEELVFKWLGHGAIPSENARGLLRRAGTLKKWSLVKQGVSLEDLDAKVEELKAKETKGKSPEERAAEKEAAKKKVEAEAAAKAKAEAEAAAAAEAEAKAAEAAEAEAAEADAGESAEAGADDAADGGDEAAEKSE